MTQPSKVISVDTCILVWGIQKTARSKEQEKSIVPRAEYLLADRVDDENLRLIIPSIVVGEYLVKTTKNEKEVLSQFLQNSLVVDYNYAAARIAAEIWSKRKSIKNELSSIRHCISADCKIIATAKAHGASVIYTENDDLIKLARLINYPAKRLPPVPPRNGELFEGH